MNRFLILSLTVLVAACGRKDGEIPLWKAVRDDIPVELSVRYVGSATSPNDSVYVTQGAVCDGKYAYFAYYSKNIRTREMERWGTSTFSRRIPSSTSLTPRFSRVPM